jgi:hypothetical protein
MQRLRRVNLNGRHARTVAAALLALAAPLFTYSPLAHARPTRTASNTQIDTHRMSNVVRVPGGEEAASWVAPKSERILFWHRAGSTQAWTQIGHSRYPNIAESTCEPTIHGTRLTGAPHATYILDGCFTGDGVLNQAAYADGRHGWGLVQPVNRHRMASRGHGGTAKHPHYAALYRELKFHHHQLVTIVGNVWFFDDGDDTRYPFVVTWRWSGGGFAKVHDNALFAHSAAKQLPDAPALPSGSCPRNGRFTASFGARLDYYRRPHIDDPIQLLVFPTSSRYPRHPACAQRIRPRTPLAVMAAHTTAHKYYLHRGKITNRRRITAPSWLLLVPEFVGFSSNAQRLPFWPGAVTYGFSPWVVPHRFGVNETIGHLGRPETYSRKHGWQRKHRPADGVVTFRHGRVVALAIS